MLIVWVLCVIGLLLVMFVRSIGDVCGVGCGIGRWKGHELSRMLDVYK